MAVQLCCFIAYLICISFSVCQFPSAFLAELLVNHLEFIKYFPLLIFYFPLSDVLLLSPSPPKCTALPAEQDGGGDVSPLHSFRVVPDSCLVYAGY